MHPHSVSLVLGALTLAVQAVPQPGLLMNRQVANASTNATATGSNATGPACLPQKDPNPKERAANVAIQNAGFIYGPSLIGDAAPFPNGTLGNARTAADMTLWGQDRETIDNAIAQDAALVQKAVEANGGLNKLDDYTKVLYQNEWKNADPLGTTPGIMTNYTQDLLFSMERLSQNAFPLNLVKPNDTLPFQVPDNLTSKIAGASLEAMQANGSLFVVDHSYQEKYEKTKVAPARYGAACTAYFFIHPQSGDFLPLAIKTNVGSDLIYTPLDSANDWLLAKMMFNVNDMFHSQMLHLVITHDVSEGVHQAALHTMSEDHPIMVILERMMLEAYSSRIVGEQLCFNPGGHWDQLMYVDNVGCREYVNETWPTLGGYQSGYLETDLQARGLIDQNGKYKFKTFPYFDDASVIRQSYETFFKSFVDSYYTSDSDVAADFEVQAWFVEATKKAGVVDFPMMGTSDKPVDKDTLVEVLTHFGFIVSVVHHALNGGDPVGSKATLPFHLPAMFAPPPTAKNVTDLMPFMPPVASAIQYIGFIASFNRPFYADEKRTLENAFSNSTMLGRLNQATTAAADTFLSSMQDLSSKIRARTFDQNGLSTGMPFVYRTLDPGYIPFFCSV